MEYFDHGTVNKLVADDLQQLYNCYISSNLMLVIICFAQKLIPHDIHSLKSLQNDCNVKLETSIFFTSVSIVYEYINYYRCRRNLSSLFL